MANITHISDPFRPHLNPVHYTTYTTNSVAEILKKHGLVDDQGNRIKPFVVVLGDDYILEADWGRAVYPRDILVTIDLPPHLQGGGGGGSNPMRIVLMVAIAVAAAYTGGAAAAWAGAAGYGAGATAAIGALAATGVMMGGMLLVNVLLPMPTLGGDGGGGAQPKSQHLIGPQSNQARLGMPLPVLHGRRRVYPDLAMTPYIETSNNSMYLYQLFCVTQGKLKIDQICIERTPIDNFEEVEYQVVQPNGTMTLFPDNVYTAPEMQDITLDGPESGDAKDEVIGHDEKITFTRTTDRNGVRPLQEGWIPTYIKKTTYKKRYGKMIYRGGYVSVPLGQRTKRLAVDIALPRGLAKLNNSGDPKSHRVDFIIQAREIDQSNSPVGSWFNLSKTTTIAGDSEEVIEEGWGNGKTIERVISLSASISGASLDPRLQTYYFNVPNGRYEVRMARTSTSDDSTRISDELHWIGIRSYMPNVRKYGNVTMLAVKIRATNNLNNNVARRINVLGTRILPVFNGKSWVEQPTRSIAWAVADVFRNKVYGRGLADKKLNLKELLRLDATWSLRGDYCDALFVDPSTAWEAATRINECGRTKLIYHAGVIDFCRNEKKSIPSAMFTPNNMLKDSFSVKFAMPKSDDPDHVIMQYTDPVSWTTKDVICALPDSKKQKGITVQMLAITNRQQAWREGIHRAAMHRVQRHFPSFLTEMEGLIPRYGDKLLLSHDVPEWGASGLIERIDGDVIHVNESLPWSGNNVIALRAKNGGVQGTFKITRIDDFSGRISGTPYISDGYSEEPTHYIFGTTESVGMEAVMLGAVPDGHQRVSIACVNYSDYPHNIENEMEMPVEVLPSDPLSEVLAVAWIKVSKTLERNLFEVSCNQSRGATRYDFEVSSVPGKWVSFYSGPNSSEIGSLPYGDQIRVRARAVGTYEGAWYILTTSIKEDEDPIIGVAPGLSVIKSGENPVYADITITGVDIPDLELYTIEQDGVVIWSGVLADGKQATIQRKFTPTAQPDPEIEPILQRVEFRAYATDRRGNNSESAIVTMVY